MRNEWDTSKPSRHKLAGCKFGRWRVIAYQGRKYQPHKPYRSGVMHYWQVRCACGHLAIVQQGSLLCERSTQCRRCGCGEPGTTKHPLYSTWLGMKGRCHNPNHSDYRDYGGRGIKVCARWRKSFSAFVADVGERPVGKTLDRRNNSLGYSPENVRWTSQRNQNLNRRPFKSKIRRTRHILAMLRWLQNQPLFPEMHD